MEETFKRIPPEDVFITVFKRKPTEEELWMGVPPDFDGNRPSGNNLIDLFAYLIRKYGRMDTSEYARIMQLKTSELRGAILAIGGIAVKSPFVMQTLSDVLGMPIRVVGYAQTCALGAAMCAAVAAGIHPTVGEAQAAMGVREYVDYVPDPERRAYYERQYERYAALGRFVEQQTNEQ